MQGTETTKGTVMILHTDSKEWLQTAVLSGLLDPEVRQQVKRVLAENAELVEENDRLKTWNRILEQNRQDNMDALLRGYTSRWAEKQSRREMSYVRLAVGALAVLVAVSVTINICMMVMM